MPAESDLGKAVETAGEEALETVGNALKVLRWGLRKSLKLSPIISIKNARNKTVEKFLVCELFLCII
jgi:hypothetical protein